MTGPLSDIVVVDLSRALAGPHAAMMLGDLGAWVIKVEHPEGGDDARGWGPPFVGEQEEQVATYFLSCNRNKSSITLDLKSAAGRGTLERLLSRADVLVENFRPGVLDRLGFSIQRLDELNPALVTLSITGFGHDGPEGGRSGYDQIAQGEGGLMSLTGSGPDEPTRVGVPIADLLAGMNGAYGVTAALHERHRTGRGRVVRTSLLASVVGVHAYQGTRYTVAGEVPQALGNHHPSICPYGLFRCADSVVQISVGSEGLWQRFAPAFELPVGGSFASNAMRVTNRAAVIGAIEEAFARWSVGPLLARLAELGIPAGEVKSLDQVYDWEQSRSQGLLIDVDHPALGALRLPGPPLRFDNNVHAGGRAVNDPPPSLGQHTEEVLGWLDQVEQAADQGDSEVT